MPRLINTTKCPNGKILNNKLCCVYRKCEKNQVLDKTTGKCKTRKCKIYQKLDNKTGKCVTKKCKKLEKINKKTGLCIPDKKAIKEKEKKEKEKIAEKERKKRERERIKQEKYEEKLRIEFERRAEKERKKQEKIAEKQRKKQEKLAEKERKKLIKKKKTVKKIKIKKTKINKLKKIKITKKKSVTKKHSMTKKQSTLSRFKAWAMKPDPPSLSIAFKTKTEITNVMKIQHDFNALGIKPNDWINDPCYLLNNLKKKLKYKGKWNNTLIKKLDNTIPEAIRDSSVMSKFTLGGDVFQFGSEIGSGSYGAIYSGKTWQKGKSLNKTNIAIKSLHEINPLEFFTEVMIQNELFCGMRGQWGNGARIPKIYFITKYSSPRSSTGWKYIIGMEPLDGDGGKFFKKNFNEKNKYKNFLKGLRDLATLLKKIQTKFKFMHRDFHAGNVMYKKIPGDNYRMYIIDFGMSTIETSKGKWLNRITQTFHYKKNFRFNPTHDLRMLMLSIFSSSSFRSAKKELVMLFCGILMTILRYSRMDNGVLFWNSYAEMIHVKDDGFHPDNIINLTNILLNDKILPVSIFKPYNFKMTVPRSDSFDTTNRHLAKRNDLYNYLDDLCSPGHVESYVNGLVAQ